MISHPVTAEIPLVEPKFQLFRVAVPLMGDRLLILTESIHGVFAVMWDFLAVGNRRSTSKRIEVSIRGSRGLTIGHPVSSLLI